VNLKNKKQRLLIHDGLILTMGDQPRVLPHHSIGVVDGLITFIRPAEEVNLEGWDEVMDGRGMAIMPGFINCHTHAAMSLMRGFADDLPLKEWLENFIWPSEAAFMNRKNVALGTRLALLEMIAAGTVMFADMYFFEDEVALACQQAGMRVLLGEGILDFKTPHFPNPDDAIAFALELASHYSNDPLIKVALAPHAVYTVSPSTLKKIAKLSADYHLPVHIHLAETRQEVEDCQKSFGVHPIDHLSNVGLLNDKLIAAHMVHVPSEYYSRLREAGVRIAHNHSANLKLASGFAPIPDYLKEKIITGLGTDGPASNNNLAIPIEWRHSSLVSKMMTGNPEAINAFEALYMATTGGARVLGVSDIIGSLEPGKAADIILISLNKPHLQPIYNIYSTLAYSMHPTDVDTVIINGRIVMRRRQMLTLDTEKILAEVNQVERQIAHYFHLNNSRNGKK
jgi:5-methylthioadenosine/S-adenosylhomocysteine deaminase